MRQRITAEQWRNCYCGHVGSLDLPFLGGLGRVQFIFFGSVESFTLTLGSCEKRVPRFSKMRSGTTRRAKTAKE
jgi:hypothetical protein